MKKLFVLILTLALLLPIVPTSAEAPVTLNLWHRWGGKNEEMLGTICADFMAEHPEIKIEITAKAGEYYELLQSMIADAAAGNEVPDIFVGGYAMLNYIASEMNPVAIDRLAPSEEAMQALYSRFDERILKVAAYKDMQVGLPYALSNMVMWINMDIWREAGLTEADIPETYEQLTKCLEQIVEKTGKNGACLATNDNWIDQVLSMSHGGSIITDDLDSITFSNDAVIGSLTWWQDLYNRGLSPKSSYTEMATMFYSGNVAVYCATPMNEGTFREYCDFDWKAWPMPTFEGYEKKLPVGGAALISFTTDQSKYDEVWTLMDYLTGDSAMTTWSATGYVCPTKAEVPATENQQVVYAQFDVSSNYLCWPGGSVGLEIDAMWTNARNSILWDNLDVASTLQALEAECLAMLENA